MIKKGEKLDLLRPSTIGRSKIRKRTKSSFAPKDEEKDEHVSQFSRGSGDKSNKSYGHSNSLPAKTSFIDINQVSNIMQLNEFSLESQSDNSENLDIEYKTILNFLRMKVLSKGNNIPWNMRKLIILAKAFIQEPYLLFLDENAIDFGKFENGLKWAYFDVLRPFLAFSAYLSTF